MILFTSDFHLGHKVIVPKYRNFESVEEHDNLLFDKMSKLNKRDILYILGDFIFDSDKYDYYIEQLSKMSNRFKIVLGNHDSKKLYTETRIKNLELQLPLFSYKNHWISHCPIHPQEIRNRMGNIHGHLHNATITEDKMISKYNGLIHETVKVPDKRYFEVGLDRNNFNFVDFEEIKEYFKGNINDPITKIIN